MYQVRSIRRSSHTQREGSLRRSRFIDSSYQFLKASKWRVRSGVGPFLLVRLFGSTSYASIFSLNLGSKHAEVDLTRLNFNHIILQMGKHIHSSSPASYPTGAEFIDCRNSIPSKFACSLACEASSIGQLVTFRDGAEQTESFTAQSASLLLD